MKSNKKKWIKTILSFLMLIGNLGICLPHVLAGLNDGLVAYYPFNGNANDESGNGNNGTVYGATLTTDRFGNANSAYSFDGVDDYINCGNNPSLDPPNQITLAAWIKRDRISTSGSADFIVGRLNTYTTRSYYLGFWIDKLQMEVSEDGSLGDREFDESNSTIRDNNWHHVVGTFDGNTIRLYIDGVYNCEQSPSGDAVSINQNISDLIIGYCRADNGYYFDGVIDEIRIYNRALSDGEIQELYSKSYLQYTITGDNEYWLYVNGSLVRSDNVWWTPEAGLVQLTEGQNIIAVKVRDYGFPGGLLSTFKIQLGSQVLNSGSDWRCMESSTDPLE